MTKTIIIADDDKSICTVLAHAVTRRGWKPLVVYDGMSLLAQVENGLGDLVISDVRMPVGDAGKDGLDVVAALSKIRPELPVIVISAQNTLMTAVKANQVGAYEYLPKPFDLDLLLSHIEKAIAGRKEIISDNSDNKIFAVSAQNIKFEQEHFIGTSPAIVDIYRLLARLVDNDLTVTIIGESGTGKELIARALHNLGKRAKSPFVAINMAAIPRELVESELFGYEKGAFTGAKERKSGKFEQAEGGTLFLDEIGDMPLEAQTKLLRVLQQGEYSAVGSSASRKTNVRIVSATHRDIAQMVVAGSFREDLYYRLSVVPLNIPSLRDRREDIIPLAEHFLNKAQMKGLNHKKLSSAAEKIMQDYSWPGNVRELEHFIYRISVLSLENIISAESVKKELYRESGKSKSVSGKSVSGNSADETSYSGNTIEQDIRAHLSHYFSSHSEGELPPSGLYERTLPLLERPLIEMTLKATSGNQIKAAQVLGINRNTLRKKINDLKIAVNRGFEE